MKGRSTATAVVMPPAFSDWGEEESWTVDCPCGVNFDDGEEMVDCDECGVWVHTSCCRVLKGHTSYVCDKCKSKKRKESIVETEVAQLLLDLPSKAPPLEDCPAVPFRSPAERAHVQGIPGGDSSLFIGVSNVFSRQLWKCTGYVPKVLNMSYSDLPPWPKEREGTFSLFDDVAEQEADEPVAVELRNKLFHEPVYDVFMEDPPPCPEKHGKREGGRKIESKHGNPRNRAHASKEDKSHSHSSRRKREDKALSSKKRAVGNRCVEGTRNKASCSTEDVSLSFKYTRASPNKLKTIRRLSVQNYKDEDVNIPNECSKVEQFSAQNQGQTIGGSITCNQDGNKLHETSKYTSIGNPNDGHDEDQGDGLSSLPGIPTFHPASAVDSEHHTEKRYSDRKIGQELLPSKQSEISKNAIGKTHLLPDKKSCTVRIGGDARIVVIKSQEKAKHLEKQSSLEDAASLNRQVDEHLEQGSGIRKLCQEQPSPLQKLQSCSLMNETSSIQLARDHEKQPVTEQKDRIGAIGQSSDKYFDHSQGKIGRSIHKKHSTVAHTLQPSMGERSLEFQQVLDENSNNLSCEQRTGLEEPTGQEKMQNYKGQDHEISRLVIPLFQEGADANVGNSTLSPTVSVKAQSQDWGSLHPSVSMPMRTVPAKPPSSCISTSISVTVKHHEELTTPDAASPRFEKMGLGVSVNNIPLTVTSKPTLGQLTAATTKLPVSGGTKCSSTIKSAKEKSKSKAVIESSDPGYMPGKPLTSNDGSNGPIWHSNETELLAKHSANEPIAILGDGNSKATALGKSLSMPVISKHPAHLKGHHSFPSSKNTGFAPFKQDTQLSTTIPEQACETQSEQLFTSIGQELHNSSVKSEKMDEPSMPIISKTLPIQLPSSPFGIPEKEVTNSTANDEEFALLLHQALNSSPRVPRVARVRQFVTSSQQISPSQASLKRPMAVAASTCSGNSQKDHNLAPRRVIKDESSRESSHGSLIQTEDFLKGEAFMSGKHEDKFLTEDMKDGRRKVVTVSSINEGSSHSSVLPVDIEGESPMDMSSASNLADGGERKRSSEIMITLPGLIEEILHDHSHPISYEYICEAVLPHWPKLRKPNGERYAYTSHRQAVLDCLRNRSAWSHLIDRGPKTNLGRKRRRLESITAMESENDDDIECKMSAQDDMLDNAKSKEYKDTEADNSDSCAYDKGRNDDVSILEDVPKGKRKGRTRRRLTLQAKGYGGSRKKKEYMHKMKIDTVANMEDQDPIPSALSEEAASDNSEDEEDILVHHGSRNLNRKWSNVESEDDVNL